MAIVAATFGFSPDTANVTPERYRSVAVNSNVPSLDPDVLIPLFSGREAYFRTRFIVVHHGGETALLEVARQPSDSLFSPIEEVRVLAGQGSARYVVAPEVDVGVASAMALIAKDYPEATCVIVEGRYSHVSFILNPRPLQLRVLDIVPPFPSKLLDQVERILADAEDLPPVVAVPTLIDSREILAQAALETPNSVLVPCRGSGMDIAGVKVAYLDERPAKTNWTMLGCERSLQIHRWFYGGEPAMVDTCPKRFLPGGAGGGPLLTRCCLLQVGIEEKPVATFVPWGATLDEVRGAILQIVAREAVPWTRI